MPVNKLPLLLLDLLYPNRCDCCGARIPYDAAVCGECKAALGALRVTNDAWSRQHSEAQPWDGCAGAFRYEGAAKRGVLAMKDGYRGFCRYAARVLADAVREMLDPAELDCVTWVPVTKQRRRIQGYAHAELLGRALAAELNVKPRGDLLIEHGGTLRQHDLPAEDRKRYAKLRFQHTGADLTGQTILLIDDILTTGSTMRTCTLLLKDMGAEKVYAAAAAYRLRGDKEEK